MAVRSVTRVEDVNTVLYTWSGLLATSTDTGEPVKVLDWADYSVQFEGNFGVGGSITFEGSNDGTNFRALTDPQGNAITKTAAAIEQIEEAVRFVRPSVTAGDGATSLVATMFMRRNR